jgi:hypothetical protein
MTFLRKVKQGRKQLPISNSSSKKKQQLRALEQSWEQLLARQRPTEFSLKYGAPEHTVKKLVDPSARLQQSRIEQHMAEREANRTTKAVSNKSIIQQQRPYPGKPKPMYHDLDDPEMARREALAQEATKELINRVGPIGNKMGNQYLTDTDLADFKQGLLRRRS